MQNEEATFSPHDLLFAIAATAATEGGLSVNSLRSLYTEYGFAESWDQGVVGGTDELLDFLMVDADGELPPDDPEPAEDDESDTIAEAS